MDILAVARDLENTPILDTGDGSTSWFDMKHEEGLAVARWGYVVEHVVSGKNTHRIVYSVEAARLAGDGGLILHSHPAPGTSFSAVDLAIVISNKSERGMVMVATTSHPVGGVMRRVRYILDSRGRVKLGVDASRKDVEQNWDRVLVQVARELRDSDTGELSEDEGNAAFMHRIMERLCRAHGVEYRREVLG